MRILHVLHNSLPLICGYSIRSGNIIRQQSIAGHELEVVTSAQHPNGDEMREIIEGVGHRRTPTYTGRQWPLLREWQLMRRLETQVEAAVAQWRPEIVHAHSPVIVGLPALRVARRHRLPFVYEIRDLWENALVDRGRFGERSLQYRLARRLETRVLRRADAVVTICQTLRDEIAPRSGQPGRVHVVPNGVDTEAFQPRDPSEQARSLYGLEGKQIILYVGTFQPYEGLEPLVRSFGNVLSRARHAHLVIVGGSAGFANQGGAPRDSQEEMLARLVDRLKLDEHVTMTGRVPHEKVGDLYSIADCVVYPRALTRTTSLTTPLKPLEAMAMGKPVVVSDLPPMKELIRDGKTGLTFPAGDGTALGETCVRLLADGELRKRLGRSAREAVLADRQWARLVRGYDDAYRSVVRS